MAGEPSRGGGRPNDAQRPGLMMGRPFGIPVYISPTWFIIAAFITIMFAPTVSNNVPDIGGWAYVVAFAYAVLLYGSVLFHELSHSVVARMFGLPVRAITLHILGGVSEIEREPAGPGREFAVAFAGPAASLVLAGGGFALASLTPSHTVGSLLLQALWVANLFVGVFNLLPGLPLDGGQVLRAVLWKVTGRRATATTAAAQSGRVLAIVILLAGGYLSSDPSVGSTQRWTSMLWSVLLAMFIWMGASQALLTGRFRASLPNLSARRLARRSVTVLSDVPLSEAIRRADEARAGAIVVVDHEGHPNAIVDEYAVMATPDQRRPWMSAGEVSRSLSDDMRLPADLAGEDLVIAMRRAPATEYLLVEQGGATYGVLTTRDVERALAVRR